MNQLQQLVRQGLDDITIRYDEPMASHTSFGIGGPADVFLLPSSLAELEKYLSFVKEHDLPFFLLGGGTNILVSDRGFRGVVIHLTALSAIRVSGNRLIAQAGATVDDVSTTAADNALSGLEFIHGMPGTIGGAVWMNARCYGGAISDVLEQVVMVNSHFERITYNCKKEQFGYKCSPFQTMSDCIWEVSLHLQPGEPQEIYKQMRVNKADREQKGQYIAPSAGSLFKNNREFGAPTGQILDELGLRNTVSGGAAIASFHGNIFINADNATAADVLSLIRLAVYTAYQKRNIRLEPEVRFIGEWLPGELSFLDPSSSCSETDTFNTSQSS